MDRAASERFEDPANANVLSSRSRQNRAFGWKPSMVCATPKCRCESPCSWNHCMAALEETVLASVHKKGAKEFTLPGLLKVVAQDVPTKKKRFGKDPFTGEDKWFAAKPASVRLKVRPLKKLKDAAL